MKKVYVDVTVRLIVTTDSDVMDVLDNMDYNFSSDDAEIESEITDYDVKDSK